MKTFQGRPLYRVNYRGQPVDTIGRAARKSPDNVRMTSMVYQVTSTASKLILPPNPRRSYLLIQNLSGDSIYVNLGSAASSTPVKGIVIFTNGNYEATPKAPVESVHILGTLALQDVIIFEGVS